MLVARSDPQASAANRQRGDSGLAAGPAIL
jgi:hypothetical protein